MNLETGIYLYYSNKNIPITDISICNGINITDNSIGNHIYGKNKIIPNGNWRVIDKGEINVLTNHGGDISYFNTVFIIELEGLLKGKIIESNFSNSIINMNFNFLQKEVLNDIHNFCNTLNHSEYFQFNAIAINKPNLGTVTYDKESKKYLGLHIDSFDSNDIEMRDFSSNRICINLTDEDRYFIFVNQTIKDIINRINLNQSRIYTSRDIPKIPYLFFKEFPSYPVLRIKCPPGTAYIAPTENIIHDGSSINRNKYDISISYRGYFSPPSLPIINDSLYGDLNLLSTKEILSFEECNKIIEYYSKSMTSDKIWPRKILKVMYNQYQHAFIIVFQKINNLLRNSDLHFSIELSKVLFIYNGNFKSTENNVLNEFLDGSDSKANNEEENRYTLIICLSNNTNMKVRFLDTQDLYITQGDGLIYSRANKLEAIHTHENSICLRVKVKLINQFFVTNNLI